MHIYILDIPEDYLHEDTAAERMAAATAHFVCEQHA
jgi:hypothetical protein